MRRTVFMAMMALLPPGVALAQESVPVTNVEIRMMKTSTSGPLRVTADTRNPNDFALRDVQFNCSIKDKAGKELASYVSTIYESFPANQKKLTKNLNVGAWPAQGYAALCLSVRGVKAGTSPANPK
jgi:hypothetical protein